MTPATAQSLPAPKAPKKKKVPPMLLQYQEYKKKYPDCMIFFQVGDFYELFYDDAVTVAKTLNLTLTSRDKNSPNPVAMCGVPLSVIDGYVERLVAAGFSAAIISQTEPATGKGMVARGLERIITPGITIRGGTESGEEEAFVASVFAESETEVAIAFTNVQSGRVWVREGIERSLLSQELKKIAATEIVLPRIVDGKKLDRRFAWVRDLQHSITSGTLKFRPETYYEAGVTDQRSFTNINGFSSLSGVAKRAARLLVNFIDETTVDVTLPISEVRIRDESSVVSIDATTRQNLELVKTLKDANVTGSLLGYMDRTVTRGGKRLLRHWILHPLQDIEKISHRQDAVAALRTRTAARSDLRTLLTYITDLERIAARSELKIVMPRELSALRDSLARIPLVQDIVIDELCQGDTPSPLLKSIADKLTGVPPLAVELERALIDSPAATLSEGGIIKDGYDEELDRLRHIAKTGASWMLELEAREREATGVGSLKIKFNNVIGYFIEVTKANVSRVPDHYIQRQSMSNAERYTTTELKEREKEVLGARGKQFERERILYETLRETVRQHAGELRKLAHQTATIDTLSSLAELADKEDLVRPTIDTSRDLAIENGKHPIVAKLLQGNFVPNSLHFIADKTRCGIITGPNMGGKSTYLRQAALLVIMAQIGSCVAATSARIGIVDKIFARLGASDDLREGESTFMVEMREAGHIVSSATDRSLLLIDEIGRGTATADGLSIARAILEWVIVHLKSRTLFATHFHELTTLDQQHPSVENLSVGSVDRGGDVIFTHEIKSGAASRSYGIEVAKLAGLPDDLIHRARLLLVSHEQETSSKPRPATAQLPMFVSTPAPAIEKPSDYNELKRIRDGIRALDPDALTPRQALDTLYRLKEEAE